MLARIVTASLTWLRQLRPEDWCYAAAVGLAFASLALFVSVAYGAPPEPLRVAPASGMYADGLLRQAVGVADRFWAAHGRALPCQANVLLYDAPVKDHSTELATTPGCMIGFRRSYRNDLWDVYTDRSLPISARRDWLAGACATAVHGRGHNLGLDDDRLHPRSVMFWSSDRRKVPVECKRWAKTFRLTYRSPDRFVRER
jgi:hypothetical protein